LDELVVSSESVVLELEERSMPKTIPKVADRAIRPVLTNS